MKRVWNILAVAVSLSVLLMVSCENQGHSKSKERRGSLRDVANGATPQEALDQAKFLQETGKKRAEDSNQKMEQILGED